MFRYKLRTLLILLAVLPPLLAAGWWWRSTIGELALLLGVFFTPSLIWLAIALWLDHRRNRRSTY